MSSKSVSPISSSGSPIHVGASGLLGAAGGAAGAASAAEIPESGFDTFYGVNPTYPLPLYLHTIGFGNSYIDYQSLEDINIIDPNTGENFYWSGIKDVVGFPVSHNGIVSKDFDPTLVSFTLNETVRGITINRTITLNTQLGSGTYGHVYKARLNTDGVIKEVAVKFQGVERDKDKIEVIKEIMIQHYIYTATSYNNHHDCTYTGQIIAVGKSYERILANRRLDDMAVCVIIMELASMDLNSFLIANGKLQDDATTACILLARKLDTLWKAYSFNHCDFHAANILLYYTGGPPEKLSSYNLKLADFGFAQLKIINPLNSSESLPLIVKDYGFISKPERDIVLLLADFICHRGCTAMLSGFFEVDFIKQTRGFRRRVDFQDYINTKDFLTCIPDTILRDANTDPYPIIKDNPCGSKIPVGPNGEPFIKLEAEKRLGGGAGAGAAGAGGGAGAGAAGAGGAGAGSGWEEFAKEAGLQGYNVEAKPEYTPGGGRRKTKVNRKQKYKKRKTKKQRGGRNTTPKIGNTRTSSKGMPYNFRLSMENYYDWLRYKGFPGQTKALKQLFNAILDVDLRKIGTGILEGKTIEQLIAIAENNRNSKSLKDKETIINAYFAETDEDRSYYLLRCLLFTPFTEGSMKKWVDAYMKSSPENRLEMLPKILYTSKFI